MIKVTNFTFPSRMIFVLFILFSLKSFGQNYISEPIITQDKELLKEAKARFDESSKIASKEYSTKVYSIYYKNSLKRFRGFREMLESGQLIYSGELFDEVNGLFEQIKSFNPELDSSLRLFIYRTDEPNAFSTGDGMIFVNLGLIYRCQNQKQLAWVLAHEIAHNELKHFDQKIIDYSEVVLSEKLKAELKILKRSKYQKATAFYELMLPQLLTRSSNSRAYERQADSLGSYYFNNTTWTLDEALGVFPVLESFDDEIWSTPLDFSHFFDSANIDLVTDRIRSKNKPSAFDIFNNEEEEDTITELITRTHPFPMERYNLLLELNNIDSLEVEMEMSSEYENIKSMSRHEIIVHLLRTDQLDKAMYYSLRYLSIDSSSVFDIRVVSYVLGMTVLAKERMMLNNYISVESSYEGDNFNAYTKFLWECTLDDFDGWNLNWTRRYQAFLNSEKFGVSKALNGLRFRDYERFDEALIVQREQVEQDFVFYELISRLGERMKEVRTSDEEKN